MPGLHLLVTGRVQGVGFRWFVLMAARRLELSGWVRNRPDGLVEVRAEGPRDRLDELEAVVREGPEGAVVSGIEKLEPEGNDLDFPFAVRR
jgi:acylphosphatase